MSVIVTKPGALNDADRKALREQGIVAVEADNPADVKLIQIDGAELSGGSLFYAAMKALNTTDTYASEARQAFARAVMAELNAERERQAAIPRDANGRFVKPESAS